MANYNKPWNYATEHAFETTPINGNSDNRQQNEQRSQDGTTSQEASPTVQKQEASGPVDE